MVEKEAKVSLEIYRTSNLHKNGYNQAIKISIEEKNQTKIVLSAMLKCHNGYLLTMAFSFALIVPEPTEALASKSLS
jgi:hypothetical protein